MTEKYVERRVTKSGIKWGVYPKKHVRDATGYGGQVFDREDDANRYSRMVQRAFQDWKDAQRDNIHIEPHTVDYLVSYYYTTKEFKERLTESSKIHYRLALRSATEIVMENSSKPFGDFYYNRVDAVVADRLYLAIKTRFSAHRAAHAIKALRRVWYVCARHGKTAFDTNPFKKMGVAGLPRRTVRWTPKEIDQFIKTADEMGYEAVGTLALMCYELCQRPVDMRKVTWDAIIDGAFVFEQQKTGVQVEIPISDELQARLDTLPRSNEYNNVVINPLTQKPFDRRLYNKYAQIVRDKAGLPEHLKLGDLRRTGATELAHSGCTNTEMRAVTGHKSLDVLSIYIVPTAKMARSAMSKRRRAAY